MIIQYVYKNYHNISTFSFKQSRNSSKYLWNKKIAHSEIFSLTHTLIPLKSNWKMKLEKSE
jgi:hypothetical protein